MSKKIPVQRQLEHQKILTDAAVRFNSTQDLHLLLNQVTETARLLVEGAEEALLLLPDDHREHLVVRSYKGNYQHFFRSFLFDIASTLPGRVYQERKRLVLAEPAPFAITPDKQVLSLAYLPLISSRKQPIGVLCLCTRTHPHIFSAYELDLLEQLSMLAALAIENLNSHLQSQARSFELALIIDSTEAVNSTLAVAEVLNLIGKSLLKALQAHWCEIMVGHEATPYLHTWAIQRQAHWRSGYVIDVNQQTQLKDIIEARESRWLPYFALSPEEHAWQGAIKKTLLHPVIVGDQVMGLLEVAFIGDAPATFPVEQVQTAAKTMASHLMVNEINRILSSARQLSRDLNAAWCTYWQLDTPYLHRVVSAGNAIWTKEPYPVRQLDDYPTFRQVVQSQAIMTYASKDAHLPADVQQLFRDLQVSVVMIVPLMMQEQSGVVMIGHTLRENKFDSGEIGMAHALVLEAANAIKNAQLYEDLQRSLDELHRTQARLVQTARLGAIGQLAAAVAHQINNPLTTVLGDTQLILGDIAPDDPNIESLKAIHRAGQRAYEVVKRLLSMARQKSADDPPELLNINLTIQNTLSLVESTLHRARVQIQLDLAANLPLAYGIHGQLEDVWMNLILNARDASIHQRKPQIGISSRYDEARKMVEVSIWDNGTGFKGVDTSAVFDAFFTTKPPGEGTGLGLYICKQVVERCGGCIIVDPTYDQGAMFRVSLPTKQGAKVI